VFVDRQGTLWAVADGTLVLLPAGSRRFESSGIAVGQVAQIAQAPDGKLWIADTRSVYSIPLPDNRQPTGESEIQVGSQSLLFDGDGSLWIGSIDYGVLRYQTPELLKGKISKVSAAVVSFNSKGGLSDDFVDIIFQDRENNIWVGTNNGLDRFRKANVEPVTLPLKTNEMIPTPGNAGDVWVARAKSLVRIHGGSVQRSHSIPSDVISAYRDPLGATWWVCNDGIYHFDAGIFTRIALPWVHQLDAPESVVATVDGSGTLWVSADREGLFYRQKGLWHRLEVAPRGVNMTPRTAFTDTRGRAWFGFVDGTMLLLNNGTIQRVFPARESPVGYVRMFNGRGSHLWVVGARGLAYFDGNEFRKIAPADAETFGNTEAVEETSNGDLWLGENMRLVKIAAGEIQRALGDPTYRVKYRGFDSFDGLSGTLAGISPFSHDTLGTDGRLWYVTTTGLVHIDPANILTNTIPPPVSIRSIKADGRVSESLTNIVLPARTTELQISYTALSLSGPERVRFRYRLEGVDKDWNDAGSRREAFYNGLGPGKYHFQVIACNNDGVWNDVGSTLEFKIAPAWFQTIWFQAFCGCVFLFLLWLLYQLRVNQLERQFAIGLDARVNERTRIARELHDTLLQDFHGLMFQFQAGRNLISRRPDEAMRSLDEAIGDTKKALAESRDAIQGLRSEPVAGGDLAELLKTASLELAHAGDEDREPPEFVLIEEGEHRDLSPAVRDEVHRIALEILRNAYRHADAERIEAEIRYADGAFRVRIRDDGKGIDTDFLKEGGRPGHWGLRGIRERAERIGARVDFWSEAGAGTEVQIEVPGSIAYERSPDGVWSRLLRKVRKRGRRSEINSHPDCG
jgi:signal transduction histidine kinase